MTELALHPDLDAEQREYLETVKRSADALLVIINDVLDLAKIEAQKLDIQVAKRDLANCVEEALRGLAFRVHEKSLELALQIASEVPRFILTDEGRLRQILINLLGNAIKFTDRVKSCFLFRWIVKRRDTPFLNQRHGHRYS